MYAILVSCLISACALIGTSDISAREWFNNPVFKIQDDRQVLLFFFECADSKSVEMARKLNSLARRTDLVVIGLTSDDRAAVKTFIDKNRIKFTVGARSRSARQFGCTSLPTIRLIARTRSSAEDPLALDETALSELETQDSKYGRYGQEDVGSINDVEELRAFVESNADGHSRAAAIWKLRRLTDQRDFQEFGESRLLEENSPWARGALRYLLKNPGETAPPQGRSASAEYSAEYSKHPDDPKWQSIRQLLAQKSKPAAEFDSEYRAHSGETAEDVLLRRLIVQQLWTAEDRANARATLFHAAESDPDRSIRMIAAMGLGRVCAIGDNEAADFLGQLAENESDLLQTRPMMEYVSEVIRTGIEDARFMSPRP